METTIGASKRTVAIAGGQVLGLDGSFRRAIVLIRGDTIEAVDPAAVIPPDARIIDARGRFVLPGLIDLHNHITAVAYDETRGETDAKKALRVAQTAIRFLQAGITTVRDVGSYHFMAVELRDAIEDGLVAGPRIRTAGLALCITGGHSHSLAREADGPDEVRKAAREQFRGGADFIKMMCSGGVARLRESPDAVQFSVEEIRAAVEEARAAGSFVSAHCHPAAAIKNAVRAGAASIEHGSFLDDEAAELMIERNVFLVPTFSIYEAITKKPDLQHLHERAAWVLKRKKETFQLVLQRGVRWGVGTDSGAWAPIESLVEEMITIRDLGVRTQDVVLAATRMNAQLMGLDDTGVVEAGKRADVIVVDGDPMQDLNMLHRVVVTIVGGVPYAWSDLPPVLV